MFRAVPLVLLAEVANAVVLLQVDVRRVLGSEPNTASTGHMAQEKEASPTLTIFGAAYDDANGVYTKEPGFALWKKPRDGNNPSLFRVSLQTFGAGVKTGPDAYCPDNLKMWWISSSEQDGDHGRYYSCAMGIDEETPPTWGWTVRNQRTLEWSALYAGKSLPTLVLPTVSAEIKESESHAAPNVYAPNKVYAIRGMSSEQFAAAKLETQLNVTTESVAEGDAVAKPQKLLDDEVYAIRGMSSEEFAAAKLAPAMPSKMWISAPVFQQRYGIHAAEMIEKGFVKVRTNPDFPKRKQYAKEWKGEREVRAKYEMSSVKKLQKQGKVETRKNPNDPTKTQYMFTKEPKFSLPGLKNEAMKSAGEFAVRRSDQQNRSLLVVDDLLRMKNRDLKRLLNSFSEEDNEFVDLMKINKQQRSLTTVKVSNLMDFFASVEKKKKNELKAMLKERGASCKACLTKAEFLDKLLEKFFGALTDETQAAAKARKNADSAKEQAEVVEEAIVDAAEDTESESHLSNHDAKKIKKHAKSQNAAESQPSKHAAKGKKQKDGDDKSAEKIKSDKAGFSWSKVFGFMR